MDDTYFIVANIWLVAAYFASDKRWYGCMVVAVVCIVIGVMKEV
jgi:hypothetical protein